MTLIDLYSLSTVPIEQCANGKVIGSATAFIWNEQDKLYLITNWHVVTGRNAQTNELELPVQPEMLRAYFNLSDQSFNKKQYEIAIRDAAHKPTWLVYPGHGRGVDVVALPVPLLSKDAVINTYPINTLSSSQLSVQIGMDVFILGYPFGVAPPGFPVWKRGSVASEPHLVRRGANYLLVDTASRPGMSGAPVIRRSWANHLLDNGSLIVDQSSATRFIGVYSGRLSTKNESDAQIGMVWPETFIRDIIAGGKVDD